MRTLIDLLPNDIDDNTRAKYARQLEISRRTNYKPTIIKNADHNNHLENRINGIQNIKTKTASKIRYIRLKKSVLQKQKNPNDKNIKKRDAERRALAKNGIIVYNHVFINNGSFYGGRRRSLEWNDEIASGAKNKLGRKTRKLKSKIIGKQK